MATFKIERARMLYSLVWKHRATPPDFHLQIMKEGADVWAEALAVMLLNGLDDPHPGGSEKSD